MNVPLKSVSCKVEGDIDLRGLVGLADDKVAFSGVRGEITLDSDATDEQLDQLTAAPFFRKTKPDVDRLVVTSPAQSASL